MKRFSSRLVSLALLSGLVGLAACSQMQTTYPDKRPGDTSPTWGDQKRDGVFGPNGINLIGGDKKKGEDQNGGGLGVNAYLWRASLDTISFMPLASADPFGGVILTEWYAAPDTPKDRFKLTVLIKDRTLRSDGIAVSVFRQSQNAAGTWVDSPVDPRTAIDLENAILTRAREMRSTDAAAVKK